MDPTFAYPFFAVLISVFVLTVVTERILIPILRAKKLGQKILEIGPRWHKSKEGTPIMGGICFILASLVVMAVFFTVQAVRGDAARLVPLALSLTFAVANGAIGFVDDYCKLIRKENEGLTILQKLFLQFAVAAAYLCVLTYTGNFRTAFELPFTDRTLELGWFAYPVAMLILATVVNGSNITDGVDGLCSSITAVIGGFYTLVAFTYADQQLSMLSAILLGSALGFLVYNWHPAKVFMGDTGSLFFGGAVAAIGFQTGEIAVMLLPAGMYIVEIGSSFLQRIYFKLTHGKRIFKMAPIHHHFEQCGWNEVKVVGVFSLVELLFCILAWFAL